MAASLRIAAGRALWGKMPATDPKQSLAISEKPRLNRRPEVNWEAIGAVAEIGGTIAVFVTLVYLSIQVRHCNKQHELDSFRHTWDSLNQFCELLTHSTENASILNRGRKSLSNLTDDEYVIFEHLHLQMLNTIESWYQQVNRTSKPGRYRDEQMDNIAGVTSLYIDHPGVREVWQKVKHTFVPIHQLVEDNLTESE